MIGEKSGQKKQTNNRTKYRKEIGQQNWTEKSGREKKSRTKKSDKKSENNIGHKNRANKRRTQKTKENLKVCLITTTVLPNTYP